MAALVAPVPVDSLGAGANRAFYSQETQIHSSV